MNFKVEVHRVDGVKRRLAVEVASSEVLQELNRTYAEMARTMSVPGFRRGRVPRSVLEQRYGAQINAEVFDRLIRASLGEALTQENLAPLGVPTIATKTAQSGEPLVYEATIEVEPELSLADYTSLEVDRPTHEVTEERVDEALHRIQQSYAQLVPIEDRDQAAGGDVVTVDWEARRDGTLLNKRERHEIELGANQMLDGFDEQLMGARVGDRREFSVARGEEGKLDFIVQVHGLARKELPALDDEFAKDHGECESIAELRVRVRGQLEQAAREQADQQARGALMARLVEKNDFDVPEALVAQRLQAMVDDVQRDWRARGIPAHDVQAASDNIRSSLVERARDQVKLSLILREIAKREGIVVSEDEISEHIDELAARAQGSADRVRAVYDSQPGRSYVREMLLDSRVLRWVSERAQYNDVSAASSVADQDQSR